MNLISSPNAGGSHQRRAACVSLSLTGVKKSRIGSILSYLRSPVVEIERNGVTGFSKRYRVWKEGGGRYQSRCHHVRADFPFERVKRLFKWLVTDKEIESRDRVNVIVRIRLIFFSLSGRVTQNFPSHGLRFFEFMEA